MLALALGACGNSSRIDPDASGIDDARVDAPPGAICGGRAGTQCKATEFCDYGRNTCGATDQTGTCQPRPGACPLNVEPTCGCDGKVYPNECAAFSAGIDINANGTCNVAADQFTCGYRVCNLASQYCKHEPKSLEPDDYTCVALPASCIGGSLPSCACLGGEPCGRSCTGEARLGLTLTCPLP